MITIKCDTKEELLKITELLEYATKNIKTCANFVENDEININFELPHNIDISDLYEKYKEVK